MSSIGAKRDTSWIPCWQGNSQVECKGKGGAQSNRYGTSDGPVQGISKRQSGTDSGN